MNIQRPTAAPVQPTDPNLVWERRSNARGRKFEGRAAIVEHLIGRWTNPSATAVDVSGGPGRWLDTLAPHFLRFSHLDLSQAALDVARQEHQHLTNVEYGCIDLIRSNCPVSPEDPRTWDVAFCLDTLLYRGTFVEAAVASIYTVLRPGGLAIIDFPTRFRASVSKSIKGSSYKGPERVVSPREAGRIVTDAGFKILDRAYHFSEISGKMHDRIGLGATRIIPYPSTWTYLVLTN